MLLGTSTFAQAWDILLALNDLVNCQRIRSYHSIYESDKQNKQVECTISLHSMLGQFRNADLNVEGSYFNSGTHAITRARVDRTLEAILSIWFCA